MNRIYLIPLVFTVLLTGCVTSNIRNTSSPNLGLQVIDASVIFLAPDKSVLSKKYLPKDVLVLLPSIPGEIFGNPSSEMIYTGLLQENQNLSFDLNNSIEVLEKSSEPLSEKWIKKGLSVHPEKTQLARIGTFAFDRSTGNPIGSGGFIDPVSKDNLILIFVDQPCEIQGGFTIGDKKFEHNIVLPSSGFHFIRIKTIKKNNYKLEYYPKSGLVNFSIHINDMVLT